MPVCVVRDELNAEWENRFVGEVIIALFVVLMMIEISYFSPVFFIQYRRIFEIQSIIFMKFL